MNKHYFCTKYEGRYPLQYQHMLVFDGQYYGVDNYGVACILIKHGDLGNTCYDIMTLREREDGTFTINTTPQKSDDYVNAEFSAIDIYQLIKGNELSRQTNGNKNECRKGKFLATITEITRPKGYSGKSLVDEEFLEKLKTSIAGLSYDEDYIYLDRYIIKYKDCLGVIVKKVQLIEDLKPIIKRIEDRLCKEEREVEDFLKMISR